MSGDTPRIGLIWAQTPSGVIGADGAIPWRIPEDTAHFKAITTGHRVVMGRKTWDSLPPRFRPLSERENVVVTRDATWVAEGALRAESVDQALTGAQGEVWVIGGSEIYSAALSFADIVEVTEVDLYVTGDTYAPKIPSTFTKTTEPWETSEKSGIAFRYVRYER